ncbi:hypothetical protein BGZ51_002906 [Haplosporangium sp. Z 767]|nr:hypothetical protein BGZ51_002906 [Haplosporangium sp. Z 767]KAF9185954.1 hypothetical protein BGZ50_002799 [Haplosporangium sp. Z 11]
MRPWKSATAARSAARRSTRLHFTKSLLFPGYVMNYLALGCNHTCQRIQIGQHLKDDCVYIGTLCRVEECRKKLLKKDLSEHMESCPYKRVDCLMCNAKVQKSQLSEHHKTCPAESVTCPHCETTRTRLRHIEHIKECPRQIIQCTLSEFGCPWTGPRFDLEAIHIPQCPYESIRGFLELSKSRMDALEQENQHLRGIFHDMKPQVQQLRDQVGQLAESVQLMTQQEQQLAAGGMNGAGLAFGATGGMQGYMDIGFSQFQHHPQQLIHRSEFYNIDGTDGSVAQGSNENEIRGINRNNSIGAESMTSNSGGAITGGAAEAHELLISENERIRSEIETLTAGLASLELKQNMAIMTESMRMQEEVQSLRAVCHGLRMQMHYLLLEQQNRHHPPGPPPPGSPAGGNNSNQAGMKGGKSGVAGPTGANGGGRPLSTSGPLRPRLSGEKRMPLTVYDE